jgi:hypothetical protein
MENKILIKKIYQILVIVKRMKIRIIHNFLRFSIKSSNFDLSLSTDLEEIIIGLMLGDLFAEKIKPSSNTRLQFKQSIKNEIYIDHLYSLFNNYCNSSPKVTTSVDKRPGKKRN